jgi:hypothetical protein
MQKLTYDTYIVNTTKIQLLVSRFEPSSPWKLPKIFAIQLPFYIVIKHVKQCRCSIITWIACAFHYALCISTLQFPLCNSILQFALCISTMQVLKEVSFLFGKSFASESIKHWSLDYLRTVVQYSSS